MAKTDYPSVDAYIAAQGEHVRPALESVRAAIRRALPEATEVISYQMPAVRLPGGVVLYFAGWKTHYSIYPLGGLAEAFAEELAHYQLSKGTVRFPLDEPVPADLIERMAVFKARELADRLAAKARKKTDQPLPA